MRHRTTDLFGYMNLVTENLNVVTNLNRVNDSMIYLFDLFGTLINEEKSNYNRALEWLANTYFEDKVIELKELSQLFKDKYLEERKSSDKENSFFNQLLFFENKLNIKITDDFLSVELDFINIFRKEKLINGTTELLKYLYKNDHKIFILSNSIFSGVSLKTYLNYLGIGKYIEKVFTSADIGFRKPSKEAFTYIIHNLKITNPKKIYFIGDSLEKDFNGSKKAGFTPILIGKNKEATGLKFNNMCNLLQYLKGTPVT